MTVKLNIGDKFNRLTVVEDLGYCYHGSNKQKRHYVRCICDCGNEVIVEQYKLKRGDTKSCGCYSRDKLIENRKKYNEYKVIDNTVFVKYTNCDEYFLCDLDDWDKLKEYAWHKSKGGYAVSLINGKIKRFHRIVMGEPDGMQVDHVYQVWRGVVDNRKCNLRVVTQEENSMNLSRSPLNRSGKIGVFWDKSKQLWVAKIKYKGEEITLCSSKDKQKTIHARIEAEERYFGDYHNVFPENLGME